MCVYVNLEIFPSSYISLLSRFLIKIYISMNILRIKIVFWGKQYGCFTASLEILNNKRSISPKQQEGYAKKKERRSMGKIKSSF